MKRPPPTRGRIFAETGIILLLHGAGIQLMARMQIMNYLLAPNGAPRWAFAAAASFLLLRGFTYGFLPGWVFARLWLWWTRDKAK